MDVYSVQTSLTLNDQLIAGLRRVATQLRTIDAELTKLQGRLNTLKVAPGLVSQFSALRTGISGITMGARQANTALGSLRISPLANSGAQALTRSLRSATTQANNLSRAMSGVHGGGGGGRLPPGWGPWGPTAGWPAGRGRGGGAGGAGAHGGPWGHGIFNRGAVHTAYDAMMVGHMVGSFFHPAMQLGHERSLAEVMGESPSQRDRMQSAAFGVSRQVPTKSAVDLMRLQRELLPIAANSLKPGQSQDDALSSVIEHLPAAARMDSMLTNYLGEKGGDSKHRASQFYQALRAGEILGLTGEKLNAFVGESAKAVVASGGRLNMEQFRQFAAVSGAAGVVTDPMVLLKKFPELMMEIGGARLGTMAATYMQSTSGRMTQRALHAQIKAGLIDPTKVHTERGKITGIDPGAFDTKFAPNSEFMRFNDVTKYTKEVITPALKAMGIDALSTDPKQRTAMIRTLANWFSDRKAQQFQEILLLHARQMEQYNLRTDRANLDYDAARARDPVMAWDAMKGSWETLRAALGDSHIPIGLMNRLADGMTWLSSKITEHPTATGWAETGAVAAGGLLGAGVAIRGITFALSGLAKIPGLTTVASGLMRLSGALGLLTGIGIPLASRIGETPAQTAKWMRSFASPGTPLRAVIDRLIESTMNDPMTEESTSKGAWRRTGRPVIHPLIGKPPELLGSLGTHGDFGPPQMEGSMGNVHEVPQVNIGGVNLTGESTFNGTIILQIPGLIDAITRIVAKGITHATYLPSLGGARPDGSMTPTPDT